MTQKIIRSRNTWVAYILLALYAYFLNIPGPIIPFLRDELDLSYAAASFHFSAFAAGILVVGLLGQVIITRFGRWRSLSIGAIGIGLGALLLVMGRSPLVTVGAIFLMGTIGSLILAVVPTLLFEEHGELRAVAISEANLLSSLVSTAAPLLVGWFASIWLGWRLALLLAGLPCLLIGLLMVRSVHTLPAQINPDRSAQKLPFLFWFYWLALVLAVSIEFCMVYWGAEFCQTVYAMSRAGAAQAVSLFLAGMMIGRAASSRLLRHYPERKIVFFSLLTGFCGFGLYWSSVHQVLGLLGLALTGLGVASLYPLILSLAISAADGRQAQAGARATLASGFAILLLPFLLGQLADHTNLHSAFAVVAVLFIVLMVMLLISRRIPSVSAQE
jgi:fucose permease